MAESKELQVKEKQEVASPAEQTRPGVVFTPEVNIFENDRQINLLADMPGVAPDDVKIEAKLEDGVLRLILPKAEKAIPHQIAVTAG